MSDNTFEHPEYEAIRTVDECDELIKKHKDNLVGKDLLERKIKAEKKEYVKAMNEQLKELSEEREHEMGVLGALQDRRKQLSAVLHFPAKTGTGN